MKIKIRRSLQSDLDSVYILHTKCFEQTDCWYKSAIRNYLDRGIVIENKENSEIIGVLLQGMITPCNRASSKDLNNGEEKDDIFEPVEEIGKLFLENSAQYKDIYGILMICIHSDFRGKGLAKKLIEKHYADNPDRVLCLNTRRSNLNAFNLYLKMGYTHIACIKNKYFLPNEDSMFMIRDIM